MDQTRAKALELAIIFASSRTVDDQVQLLALAEAFRTFLEPPEPTAVDGDNYPRIGDAHYA